MPERFFVVSLFLPGFRLDRVLFPETARGTSNAASSATNRAHACCDSDQIENVLTRVLVTAETLLDCFGSSFATSSAWGARNAARPNSASRGTSWPCRLSQTRAHRRTGLSAEQMSPWVRWRCKSGNWKILTPAPPKAIGTTWVHEGSCTAVQSE